MTQQQELIPMAAGDYLKQQRLKRKLSLATVAQATCLDEKLLREIEQGQMDHIALVYKNGYIKVYAHYLQIPDAETKALIALTGIKEPAVHNVFAVPPKRKVLDKWLRATSYVLASLLIGTLAWQFTHEAVRLSQDVSQLPDEEDGVANFEKIAIQAQARGFTGPVKASIAPLRTERDNNTKGLDTANLNDLIAAEPVLMSGESRLQVSVSADSWVEITDATDQQLEMDLLRGGSNKIYHGKPPFRLLFGRASAVRLIVDGETVDLMKYARDDVVQLSWPKKLQTAQRKLGDTHQ